MVAVVAVVVPAATGAMAVEEPMVLVGARHQEVQEQVMEADRVVVAVA
jgi:hypothetical protein